MTKRIFRAQLGQKFAAVLSCVVIITLVACAHKASQIKLISNDPALAIGAPFAQSNSPNMVSGKSCVSLGEALKNALAHTPGTNALANATVTSGRCHSITGIPTSLPSR